MWTYPSTPTAFVSRKSFTDGPKDGRKAGAVVNAHIVVTNQKGAEVRGLSGHDLIVGASGADELSGGDGDDFLIGGAGEDELSGGRGNDRLIGGSGADEMEGGSGNDVFIIENASDHVSAPSRCGDVEEIEGGSGTDRIWFGGDGTLTLSSDVSGVELVELKRVRDDRANTPASGDGSDGEMTGFAANIVGWNLRGGTSFVGNDASNIIVGSLFNDSIAGHGDFDVLFGLLGDDLVDGGDGGGLLFGDGISALDLVSFGRLIGFDNALLTAVATFTDGLLAPVMGNDTLLGGAGVDIMFGGGGNDVLAGGGSTDILVGGSGTNSLDGGSGFDLALYLSAAAGVTADLGAGSATTPDLLGSSHPLQITDTLQDIEGLVGSFHGDTLTGGAGDVTLVMGLGGNDVVDGGTAGVSILLGGAGDDQVRGGAGLNLMFGDGFALTDVVATVGAGLGLIGIDTSPLQGFAAVVQAIEDVVAPEGGADSLLGAGGTDVMFGGAGADTLEGGAGTDLLNGGAGDDVLDGGEGTDIILGEAGGADTIRGGDGLDIVLYVAATAGVTAGPGAGPAPAGIAAFGLALPAGDVLDGVEGVMGSAHGDQITAGAEALSFVAGMEGADNLTAGSGTTVLIGGGGDDTLQGGASTSLMFGDGLALAELSEVASAVSAAIGLPIDIGSGTADLLASLGPLGTALGDGAGDDLLNGGSGSELMSGGEGADTLSGEEGTDLLLGGAGDDSLQGGGGTDILMGGAGNNTLDGGDGLDVVFYSSMSTAVTVDLAAGTGSGDGFTDAVQGVEAVFGSSAGDTVTGGDGGTLDLNLLFGLDGDDALTGGTMTGGLASTNILVGGNGNDTVTAGDSGISVLFGDGFDADAVVAALNGLIPGAGTGFAAVISGLPLPGGTDAGDDVLQGAGGTDVMFSGAGADSMSGAGGTDIMNGGDGADTLIGGAGADDLTGGAGADRFVFGASDTANPGAVTTPVVIGAVPALSVGVALLAGIDVIRDFLDGVDKIELTGFGGTMDVFDRGTTSYTVTAPGSVNNARRIDVVKVGTDDAMIYVNSDSATPGFPLNAGFDKYEAAIFVIGGASMTWTGTGADSDFIFA